jgi:membrane associated rhomboid family serine protease
LVPPTSSEPVLDENGDVIKGSQELTNFESYALAIGDGRLHPIQWVTHNFLHYGFLHLAGNMLFLWSFGIMVEGKLGALKFLMTYLAIGTLHGALVQTLLMRSGLDKHAAGASAVIYGLLAVCMIWAPRNELNCTLIFIIGFRVLVHELDLYYTTVAMFYIGEQLFGLISWGSIGGKIMVSEMGHLSGAFWGAVMAVVLLKAGLVDCEGWDLFTIWARWRKLGRDWKQRVERLDHQKRSLRWSMTQRYAARAQSAGDDGTGGEGPDREGRGATAVRRIRSRIDEGDIAGALGAYDKAARSLLNWPSQLDLLEMIKALHAWGAERESVRLMRDYFRFYPGQSSKVRLKLAHTLIRDHQRPVAALRILQEIPPGSLPADLEMVRGRLAVKAHQMVQKGVLELEGDD